MSDCWVLLCRWLATSTLKLVPVVKDCTHPNDKNVVFVVTTGDPATMMVFKGLEVRSKLKSTVKAGSNEPRGCMLSDRVAPEMEPTPPMPPNAPPPAPTPAPIADAKSGFGIVAPTESTPRAACPDLARSRSAWAE